MTAWGARGTGIRADENMIFRFWHGLLNNNRYETSVYDMSIVGDTIPIAGSLLPETSTV